MEPQTRNWVPPQSLTAHHLNRAMPRIHPGMPEWERLFEDVRERGIQEPIRVVPGNKVVDGWTRREIAMAIPLDLVPVVEVPEDEGVTTLVEHLVLQKHLSKGQRAYLCYHLAKGLEGEKQARKRAALKKGNSPMPIQSASGNIGDFQQFCAAHGFSRDVFEQARTLHGIFNGDPSVMAARGLTGLDPEALRKEWEPKILDLADPVGLGRALAGMAGARATEGREKLPNPEVQLDLFEQGVTAINRVASSWGKLRREKRPEIIAAWSKVAAGWPKDFRIELARSILRDVDGWESEVDLDDAKRIKEERKEKVREFLDAHRAASPATDGTESAA